MKRILLFSATAITALLFSFKVVEPSTWTLDKSHAKLGFSITHLMLSDVEGSFKNFDAKITSPNADFNDAVVELTANANSINTENEQRDTHLKNEDFLDVAKYSTLSFKSTSFKKVASNKYKVKGNLTLHGVTKPVELDATARVGVNPMNKKSVAGFKITGTIKRSDFKIGPNYGAAILSDEIELIANAEFVKN